MYAHLIQFETRKLELDRRIRLNEEIRAARAALGCRQRPPSMLRRRRAVRTIVKRVLRTA